MRKGGWTDNKVLAEVRRRIHQEKEKMKALIYLIEWLVSGDVIGVTNIDK